MAWCPCELHTEPGVCGTGTTCRKGSTSLVARPPWRWHGPFWLPGDAIRTGQKPPPCLWRQVGILKSGPENLVIGHGEMAEQTQLQVQDPLSCGPQMPQAKALSLRARCPLPLWCLHNLRILQLYPLRGPSNPPTLSEQHGAEAAPSLTTSSQGLVDNSG